MTGKWSLEYLSTVPQNGLKVFSCFHCCGGSTMGFKLAGYNVIGGVEIDPQMMGVYRANHKPKHSFLMGVQHFNKLDNEELPEALFDLDILDGSPPCSSFSTNGVREKKWGKATKFREGQAVQVLDDLFFAFIETAKKLKPKVVIAENVRGLIIGNAKGYVKQIIAGLEEAGYTCQIFFLNASRMGVPQVRERVFFICRRNDLLRPPLKMDFNEDVIPFSVIKDKTYLQVKPLGPRLMEFWSQRRPNDVNMGNTSRRIMGKDKNFSTLYIYDNKPLKTITTSVNVLFDEPRLVSEAETIRGQTFPQDFNFLTAEVQYVCGMSVPPFMMQRIADQIERQWLDPLLVNATN